MKRIMLLAAVLWAGISSAQGVGDGQRIVGNRGSAPKSTIVGGMLDADTTAKALRLNASGSLLVSSPTTYIDEWNLTPLLTNNFGHPSGLTGGLVVVDSSAAIQTYQYTRMFLVFSIMSGDSAQRPRFAVQVRGAATAVVDTGSTWAWYRWAPRAAAAAADGDSIGLLTAYAINNPSSSEFTVMSQSTSAQLGTRIIYVPLVQQGAWFWAPYTSVKVRCLGLDIGGAATNTADRAKVTVSLIGTTR